MTTTKLGDEFLRIPKLDVSGSNWVIFKEHFLWALDARGILDHVEKTGKVKPVDPIPEDVRASGKLSDGQKVSTTEWSKELKEWKQGEAVAKQQIASSIPDSLFMKIHSKPTAREIWEELEKHFQNRSRMVSIDLRRRIQDQCCPEKGDVVAHFATIRTMREDLASMGQPLTENDFYAIILGSLPGSYDSYISAINATSSVLDKTLSADDLMLTITEEYERRNLKNKSSKKDENVALYSNDAGKGRKGGSSTKKNVECFNCKKKGHYKSECWAPGGGKEGEGPKQKGKGKLKEKESVAVAKETGKEEKVEEAWLAMLDESEAESDGSAPYFDDFSDLDDLFEPESPRSYFSFDEMDDIPSSPSFLEVDSSGDSDFFDIGNTSDNSNLKIHSVDEETPRSAHYIDLDNDMFNGNMQRIQKLTLILPNAPDDDAAYTSLDVDQLAAAARPSDDEVDLYDSGATRHMSGFKHRFINFVKTEDVPITAADKRMFKAIGKGDMYIYLPNGAKQMSRVLLKTVLYAPLMGVTLVSISRITSTGSTVIFTKDVCQIYNRERQMIGEIKVKGGLYRVHASSFKDEAHAINTQNLLSIYELHRRLGHISYDRVKLLMSKKLVSGVELDASVETTVCESCEWAKGERKQMSKVREGERHTAVGDEVHSDLWGPAPVETISRKKYYISFTDDHSRYTNVYFLLTKDEAFNFYQAYEAWLSTQHNTRIKCLRSD